jgi:hypothetical protein
VFRGGVSDLLVCPQGTFRFAFIVVYETFSVTQMPVS